jgi:hypothetical protein
MDEQESIRRADGSSGSSRSIRIIACSITILITASIACGLTPSTTEESVSPTIEEAMSDQQPTLGLVSGDEDVSVSDPSTPCSSKDWSFIPTDVITVDPQHVSSNRDYSGFKFIVVPMAILNNSPYWGYLGTRVRDTFVTTEDGFIYPPEGTSFYTDFPYLAESARGLRGSWGIDSQLEISNLFLVPPGFTYHGSNKPLNAVYGEPDTWLQLVFKVAEGQNHFFVTIPTVRIACLSPEGSYNYGQAGPIVLDLARDTREVVFPTDNPDDYDPIDDPIIIEGLGSIDLIDIKRDGESLFLDFQFTNASQGYEVGGKFDAYLIGDDGLFRSYECCASFKAGPGQTSEFQVEFVTGSHTGSYKLLWIADDASRHIYNLEGY